MTASFYATFRLRNDAAIFDHMQPAGCMIEDGAASLVLHGVLLGARCRAGLSPRRNPHYVTTLQITP
jgi:hypothetical protein